MNTRWFHTFGITFLLALVVGRLAYPNATPIGTHVFGFSCASPVTLDSPAVRRLAKDAFRRLHEHAEAGRADRAVAADLDRDGTNELFVPLTCSPTCNCKWGVFTVAPARNVGIVDGCVIRVLSSNRGWADLLTYGHMSAMDGVLTSYVFTSGSYLSTTSRAVTAAEADKALGCDQGDECCR